MKKKTVALLLVLVLAYGAAMGGTIAYLTDSAEVVNTFTVGKVQIKLDEADVKPDGTYEENHDSRVEANSYKLMPGHTYIKDPTVTVEKGSESSYVRMLVTLSNASALKEVFGANFLPENYVKGWDSATWIASGITENTTDNTITYEFRYKETVAAPTADVVLDDLFEEFTVPGTVDNNQLDKLSEMTITVVAHAIQADGFDTADAAWNVFSAN